MALDTFLAGLSGGLNGLSSGYQYERTRALNEQKLETQNQIAQLRAEVAEMVARVAADSRRDVATTTADSRRDVAGTNADARRDVANITQTGANGRATQQNDYLYKKLFTDSADRNRAVDVGSTDRRYGIDTNATTTRRGQDIGATTARRGQDLNFTLGGERNALVERGQDIDVDQGNVMEAGRTTRAGMRKPAFSFDHLPDGTVTGSPLPITPSAAPPAPAAAPVVKPPSVLQQRGTIPVTPRAAVPAAAQGPMPNAQGSKAPAPAANPKMAALEQQAAAKLAELRATKDPAKQAAIRQQLAQLKAQRDALVGGAR